MAGPENVKLLVTDVDGVLTNGRVTVDDDGRQALDFSVSDGAGTTYLARSGIPTVILTGRNCRAVLHRARDMNIHEVHLAVRSKADKLAEILSSTGVGADCVCYVGDDFNDVPVMRTVGFPVAVANARPEVKSVAAYVTRAEGGCGAIREVAELILKSQNKWEETAARYGLPDT